MTNHKYILWSKIVGAIHESPAISDNMFSGGRNMVKINIFNEQNEIVTTNALNDMVCRCIETVISRQNIECDLSVDVLFVDNAEMAQINQETRGIYCVTDVLSFPMIELDKAGVFSAGSADIDLDSQTILLGDIVLSLEKALEQAVDFHHSFEREVSYLIVHSVLHLLGFDHDNNRNKKIMRKKEEEILELLNMMR